MFGRILVALDETERADDALAASRALAERFDSELVLLQVATWPAYLLDMAAAFTRLDHFAARLRAAGLRVRTVVRDGIAEDGIAAVAREEAADLVVLAPHRHLDRERLTHILGPHVSAKMISHAPIPFLIVPEPPHTTRALHLLAALRPEACPIVLGLDGTPFAEQAIPVASELAHSLQQRLILVRVVHWAGSQPLGSDHSDASHTAAQALLEEEREAHEYLAAVRRRIVSAYRVKVQTRVVGGDVVGQLVELAEAEGAFALVIGTHGPRGLARMLCGSVAADLVYRTPTPLVVVPPARKGKDSGSGHAQVPVQKERQRP